jgi:hypothetical protein
MVYFNKKMTKPRDTNRKKAAETRKVSQDNRETAIALRIAGSSYAEIARELSIHPTTAKTYCFELDETEPVEELLKTRDKIVTDVLRKTLRAFNPDPKNTTLQGLVALLNYADKIQGIDRLLANQAAVDPATLPPILRIELTSKIDDVQLDDPADFEQE